MSSVDESNEALLTLKTLQCIKRKESVFKAAIEEVHPRHVVLRKSAILTQVAALADVLAGYAPETVLVLATNQAQQSVYQAFAYLMGYRVLTRYRRGQFNNCMQEGFTSCRVLFSCHDRRDRLAILDAKKERAKIVGFSNLARGYIYYDHVVYGNTFVKDAMIVYFYLLYKELKLRANSVPIAILEFTALCK